MKIKEIIVKEDNATYKGQRLSTQSSDDITQKFQRTDSPIPDTAIDAEGPKKIDREQLKSLLIKHLDSVPADKSDVTMVKAYYGFPPFKTEHSWDEIAKATGISKEKVKTKIQKVIWKLRHPKYSRETLPYTMESKLDKPTPTVAELVKRHNVSSDHIKSQLAKGTKVEFEHTSDKNVAREIALDHIGEDPNYYTKLSKVEGE